MNERNRSRVDAAILIVGLIFSPGAIFAGKDKPAPQPLEFELSAEEAPAAWSRAQEWLAENGDFPITVSNETLIQTGGSDQDFDAFLSYTVVRSKTETGGWRVKVSGRTRNPLSARSLKTHLRILAAYIQSGKVLSPKEARKN